MLVFLQIPRSTTSPYKAFREALGDDAVGWLGRNLKDADLDSAETVAKFKVIGGRLTLARALAIPDATIFATIINDPVSRSLGQWNEAIGDINHPFHAATHTFMQRELFEEDHPFAQAMSNVATKFLLKSSEDPVTAEAALEAIKSRRFLIGETANAKAFATMLSRRLGLEPTALNEVSFRAPPPNPQAARGELLRLIRDANAQDIALIEALRGMMEEKRPVVRIKGDRPERPARPDRAARREHSSDGEPAAAQRPARRMRPEGAEGADRPARRERAETGEAGERPARADRAGRGDRPPRRERAGEGGEPDRAERRRRRAAAEDAEE